ncbi:LysM domain containing protein [Melia azedarach]|nr:LysM domain containing protein [Melia azedarach]
MADGLKNSKQLLVHVVKEGETLTSISKQYGVSMYSIAAANKNIVDIDIVFEGQKLNIPSFSREEIQVTRKNRISSSDLKEICWRSLNIIDGLLDRTNFTMQITHGLPHAKTAGYFLVLVPLIAFCITCMIGAFHTRITGDSGRQSVNESKGHRHGSKNVRWKSALCDIIEGDALDSDSIPDSNDPSEDEAQASFEESSHAYRKLEHDYEKFLSECGMSKWGYWRGGSPE